MHCRRGKTTAKSAKDEAKDELHFVSSEAFYRLQGTDELLKWEFSRSLHLFIAESAPRLAGSIICPTRDNSLTCLTEDSVEVSVHRSWKLLTRNQRLTTDFKARARRTPRGRNPTRFRKEPGVTCTRASTKADLITDLNRRGY